MNGQVYDYNLGRFMSVDPFIHGGSQGVNPYSYIMNNPLSGTDPSGYAPEQETIELQEGNQLVTDVDGNLYIDQGGDTLTKVETVTTELKNGTTVTANYDSGGSLTSASIHNNEQGRLDITDIGSENHKSTFYSRYANQDGSNAAPPSGFNGTETASTGVIPGPFGLPMPGPKSPQQLDNDKNAALALDRAVNTLIQSVRTAVSESKKQDRAIVIGETQKRVDAAAIILSKWLGYHVETISPVWPWKDGEKFKLEEGKAFNRRWINDMMNARYNIYDIGIDDARSPDRSLWYKLEREEISRRNYDRHQMIKVKGL